MKKRVLSLFLSGLLLVSALSTSACGKKDSANGGKTAEDEKSSAPVTIKWLGYPTAGLYPGNDAFITQELNKRFNVKLEVIKADPAKDQELHMLFASGDIPDHFLVSASGVQRILNEGLVRNIPEATLKEVAPTFYNAVNTYHPSATKQNIYEKGNFKAIPEGKGELFPMTAIRTDWLKKVGISMPTNLKEFEEMCRLFREGDPDGNGKKDTYATYLTSGFENIQTLAAAFQIALPGGTIKNDSWNPDNNGKLIKAQVSENYKSMLKFIANLYKKGYIHPDVTLKSANVDALYSDGIIGARTGSWTAMLPKYRPSEWLSMTTKKNPNATIDFLPALKGNDGKDATFEKEASVWRYMCVGKDTSDVKLKKILQIIEAQLKDNEVHNLVWRGTEGTHFTKDGEGMAILKDEYATNEKQAELGMKFFIANFRNEEQGILSHGKDSVKISEIQSKYKVRNQLIPSGTVIESVNEFGADVKKIEQEFYVNAVTGVWDIDSEWNKYLDKWNKAGGEKITAEVNDIYNKNFKK